MAGWNLGRTSPLWDPHRRHYTWEAMRQPILGSHTPPCHRRMVITTLSSMFSLAALQRKPDQCRMLPCIRHSRWPSKVLRLSRTARSHHPPTAPVGLKPPMVVHNFTMHSRAVRLIQSKPNTLVPSPDHSFQLRVDNPHPLLRYRVQLTHCLYFEMVSCLLRLDFLWRRANLRVCAVSILRLPPPLP